MCPDCGPPNGAMAMVTDTSRDPQSGPIDTFGGPQSGSIDTFSGTESGYIDTFSVAYSKSI